MIHDVCSLVGLSYATRQRILLDELNMRCTAAKFVPRLLTDDQKSHRLEVSMGFKEQVRNDPDFVFQVVSGDEICIYGYDLKIAITLVGVSVFTVAVKKTNEKQCEVSVESLT